MVSRRFLTRAAVVVAVLAALVALTPLGARDASATGLTLAYAHIDIGGFGWAPYGPYTPQAVLTGDTFLSSNFALTYFPNLNPFHVRFKVDTLTPDASIQISNLQITNSTYGCRIVFLGPLVIDLLEGLEYFGTFTIDPLDLAQFRMVGCTFDEIQWYHSLLENYEMTISFSLSH